MKVKKLISVVIMLTFFQLSSQINYYNSLDIDSKLKVNANAVVRINDVNINIESHNKAVIKIKRIVTVLNEKGNRYLQAGSGYNRYLKIKKIEAIIYNESGKEIEKIRKKDFIDHSAVDGGTLYSDSRVLFMNYFPISYPYTVEFICELETPNTASIPTWRPINDYYMSIENDNYSLMNADVLGLRIKEKNFGGFEINKISTPNHLSYSLKNVPALKPEDLSPSFKEFSPQAMIAVEKFHYNGVEGHAKNWLEFGNWIYNELLEGRNEVSNETKQHIINLTKGEDDLIEKAKIVYDYVQNNTRYISVQVGIGGIQPIAALEVDKLKYGDCKGLTNYTQSLLKIAGVNSYYTIVEAGSEIVNLDNEFPSLEQGNHIILAIPHNKEMVWLDCTSQTHPFGFIGDFTDNRNVLVVKKDSSTIMKTSSYSDTLNYQYTEADVKFSSEANIESDIIIKTKGIQYDNRFFIEKETNKNIIEYYKEYWDNVNNLEVIDYSFENNKDLVEFTEKVKVYARSYASINGERLILIPNAFNKNSFIPNRYRDRKLPIEIQRGYLDEDNFSYTIPEGYSIEAIPDNITIKNKFGEYLLEFSKVENKIIYKRKLSIFKGEFDKAEYNFYRNFRKKISYLDNSKIILKKNKS